MIQTPTAMITGGRAAETATEIFGVPVLAHSSCYQ